MILRIGTRGSTMARAQTRIAMDALSRVGVASEAVILDTSGDKDQDTKLSAIGGKGGAFISSIRQAMRDGLVDVAMHSLKDIPGNDEYDQISKEFMVGAYLPREDPRDCMVIKNELTLDKIAADAIFGTTSLRRTAFLKRLFPGCRVVNSRGAADTRIRKLDEGIGQRLTYSRFFAEAMEPPADAIILAKSGLDRIGLEARIARIFSLEEMCPALGQGVVVLEFRRDRADLSTLLGSVNDERTAIACRAERAMLRALNGHCNSPIAGYCRIDRGDLQLRGIVVSPDCREFLEVNLATTHETPERLGESAARRLLRNGADRMIADSRVI